MLTKEESLAEKLEDYITGCDECNDFRVCIIKDIKEFLRLVEEDMKGLNGETALKLILNKRAGFQFNSQQPEELTCQGEEKFIGGKTSLHLGTGKPNEYSSADIYNKRGSVKGGKNK